MARAPRRPVPALPALLLLATTACHPPPPPPVPPAVVAPAWSEVLDSGLELVHDNGMTGERYLVEIMGGGAALLDYDRDGDLDVAVTRGGSLSPGGGSGVALFRNESGGGGLRFVEVGAEAGLDDGGHLLGLAVGDADGDGWPDLYGCAFGANRLWRNRGDGSFEDISAVSGTDDPGMSVTATWFDADNDGDQDLYVGNYLRFRFEEHRRCPSATGYEDYCGPLAFPAAANRFYRNQGDGRFEEDAAGAGLAVEARYTLGVVAIDADGNSSLDLYEANDGQPNRLWIADGHGRYVDRAVLAGCAVNADGRPEAGMGIALGDHDGDGDEDLLVTHRNQESHTLYSARGGGVFEDVTRRAGLGDAGWNETGFGTAFLDGDGDGDLDLLVVNGAVISREPLLAAGDPFPLHETDHYFAGTGEGRFEPPVDPTGAGRSEVGRGLAWGDLDDDGDPDAVVVNSNGPVRLLAARWSADTRWVGFLPIGAGATGARVCLLGEERRCRWSRRDGSYASSSDPRVRFAGPGADRAPGVEVRWADGEIERFPRGAPGRYHELVRGRGEAG